jgi:hypothetical protein
VALQLHRARVHLVAAQPELEKVVGGDQAREDRGGARAQAPGEGDLAADLEPQAIRRMQGLEGADAEVRPVLRQRIAAGVDDELAGLRDIELQMQCERRREDVEAGPEVRGRRRHSDQAAAGGHALTRAT